jgi:[ribosomal protein S18]-alanine N-acetyltransferase
MSDPPTPAAVSYRTATPHDLRAVGEVYLRAFPESLQQFHSPDLTTAALADVLLAPRAADPGCILAAEAEGGRVVGYIVAPRDAGQIAPAALRAALPLRWLWHWLSGRYRLSVWGAAHMVLDKLHSGRAWRMPGADVPARVVSVAVDPEWQGRGVGRGLMEAALRRLHEVGVARVRLEVRPENTPARRLYASMGFEVIGEFRDSRGPWLVMVGATPAAGRADG